MENLRRRIVAHRGIWEHRDECNTQEGLSRALSEGFGIEFDVRDRHKTVVVSHDPPSDDALKFRDLLKHWKTQDMLDSSAHLAINVKSDGLVSDFVEMQQELGDTNYYFFDMSFPQQRAFIQGGLPIAERVSEFEAPNALSLEAGGISRLWLDAFESDWWLESSQASNISPRSRITIVSPELHGRDPRVVWQWFAGAVREGFDVSICTDRPFELLRFAA
jgi:hypothetical protein